MPRLPRGRRRAAWRSPAIPLPSRIQFVSPLRQISLKPAVFLRPLQNLCRARVTLRQAMIGGASAFPLMILKHSLHG